MLKIVIYLFSVQSLLGGKYFVLEAKDGEEAVDMARNLKPDLILLDLMMPKLDGLTACYAIKTDQATEAIPVVMLTGIGYKLNVKLSQELGANEYITKPFSSRGLLDTVSRLLSSSISSKGDSDNESS